MRHGHIIAVNRVRTCILRHAFGEMRHNLMAEKIEVHPCGIRPPFPAAENCAIKLPRGTQIVHRESEMKTGYA